MATYLARFLRSVSNLLRRSLARLWEAALKKILPWFAPIIQRVAQTGYGTDECLRLGCLPMRVHYYSPVPDIDELKLRRIWEKRSELPGISINQAGQLKLLEELGEEYGKECHWPHEATPDPHQFFTNNSGFSYGCAAATHSIMRKFKPRRVIEIGSGSSSRVISAALRANERKGLSVTQYTIIDPFPGPEAARLPSITRILEQKIELLELGMFSELEANDILFIDSGHTVRIGSDVNFLILDVLPRLRQGVLVHFHDIPLPYEYADVYYTNSQFRMFWTESYLLQAFLCFNHAYEVLLAMNFLMRDHRRQFHTAFPNYDEQLHRDLSHSFWIRRAQ